MKNIVSKWVAMGYQIALSGDKIVLEYVGEGEPDPAVKDLVPELTVHKLTHLEHGWFQGLDNLSRRFVGGTTPLWKGVRYVRSPQ